MPPPAPVTIAIGRRGAILSGILFGLPSAFAPFCRRLFCLGQQLRSTMTDPNTIGPVSATGSLHPLQQSRPPAHTEQFLHDRTPMSAAAKVKQRGPLGGGFLRLISGNPSPTMAIIRSGARICARDKTACNSMRDRSCSHGSRCTGPPVGYPGQRLPRTYRRRPSASHPNRPA